MAFAGLLIKTRQQAGSNEIIAVNKPDVFADRLFNGFIPSFSRSGIKMGKNTDISIISPIFLCYPQTSVSRPVIIEYYLCLLYTSPSPRDS